MAARGSGGTQQLRHAGARGGSTPWKHEGAWRQHAGTRGRGSGSARRRHAGASRWWHAAVAAGGTQRWQQAGTQRWRHAVATRGAPWRALRWRAAVAAREDGRANGVSGARAFRRCSHSAGWRGKTAWREARAVHVVPMNGSGGRAAHTERAARAGTRVGRGARERGASPLWHVVAAGAGAARVRARARGRVRSAKGAARETRGFAGIGRGRRGHGRRARALAGCDLRGARVL